MLTGLDAPCPACARESGAHTLREWADCIGASRHSLPFAEIPSDAEAIANENLSESFELDGDPIMADHIVAKAVTLSFDTGPVRAAVPGVLHEFQLGVPGGPPRTVARVIFIGDGTTMRGYGRLIRDTANGAVNAAARAQ